MVAKEIEENNLCILIKEYKNINKLKKAKLKYIYIEKHKLI